MCVLAGGCASTERSQFSLRPTPIDLVAIERTCGLQGHFFYMLSHDELMVMPNPAEKFEAVECAIGALLASEYRQRVKIGFVGNAKFADEEKK